MILAPCGSCSAGDHTNHVAHWDVAPEGVLGGAYCNCTGDCAEGYVNPLADLLARANATVPDPYQQVISGAERILDSEKHPGSSGASMDQDYGFDIIEDAFARIWEEAYNTGVSDMHSSYEYDGGQTHPARVCPYKKLTDY